MIKNEPVLFIDSPICIRKTKKGLQILTPSEKETRIIDKYQKLISDMDIIKKKGINSLCLIKTKNKKYEGNFKGFDEEKLYLDKYDIELNDILEINIVKFEKG